MEKFNKIDLPNAYYQILFMGSLMILSVVLSSMSYAGTDATFDAWVTQMQSMLDGSLGKGIAIGFVIVGIVMGMVQQSLMAFAIGIGAALGLIYIPDVIDAMFAVAL